MAIFGYNTAGGSVVASGLDLNQFGGSVFTLSEAGTLNSGQYRCLCYTTVKHIKMVVVRASDNHIMAVGSVGNVPLDASGWVQSNFASEALTAGDYIIGAVADGYIDVKYDAGSAAQWSYETDNNYTTPTDPAGVTTQAYKVSAYCDYTASGGGPSAGCAITMASSRSLTEGFKGSDVGGEYNLSVKTITDGFKLGDTTLAALGALIYYLTLSEGMKVGEGSGSGLAFPLTFPLDFGSASPVAEMLAGKTVSDGFKTGDSTLRSMLSLLSLADGLKLGDSDSVTLATVLYYLTLTDGLKGGDSRSLSATMLKTITDGLKLGDSATRLVQAFLSINDGLKLIDSTIYNTSTLSPNTMADDASTGATAWSNVDNAKTSNDSYATAVLVASQSHRLKATNFGFSIPSNAAISGIKVEAEGKTLTSSEGINLGLYKSTGFQGNYYGGGFTTTEQYTVFGSSTSLWNKTWTPAEVNDANFGVGIVVGSTTDTISVDHIRITIYYSLIYVTMSALPTLTDGLKLSDADSLSALISVLASDGFKLSDIIDIIVSGGAFGLAITEGLKVGDSTLRSMLALLSLTDGMKFGDSKVATVLCYMALLDGLKGGDTATKSSLANLTVADGLKLGDVAAKLVQMYRTVTDGLKLSDSATLYALFLKAVADGFKLSDASNLKAMVSATDGFKLGDSRSLIASAMRVALSEGLKLSDITTSIVGVFYYLSVTEGLKLGESALISMLSRLTLSDGTKLSDSAHAMRLIRALVHLYLSGNWVDTDIKLGGF